MELAERRVGGPLPDDYRSFLEVSNGALLYPWKRNDGGVRLLGVPQEVDDRCLIYRLADLNPATQPYFIVAVLNVEGEPLAMGPDGAVYFLDHDEGPVHWARGIGVERIGDSLESFVLELAARRGAWWWLPGDWHE